MQQPRRGDRGKRFGFKEFTRFKRALTGPRVHSRGHGRAFDRYNAGAYEAQISMRCRSIDQFTSPAFAGSSSTPGLSPAILDGLECAGSSSWSLCTARVRSLALKVTH